jgi:hypothetical protein
MEKSKEKRDSKKNLIILIRKLAREPFITWTRIRNRELRQGLRLWHKLCNSKVISLCNNKAMPLLT